MKILFIGDIMGRAGRDALQAHLPALKQKYTPDVVIVNGENAAHGVGITEKICKEFYDIGVDCITTGNHVWDQREILSYINRDKRLLRPINFPEGTPGNGLITLEIKNGQRITVINAMGRLFMETLDDPFAVLKKALEKITLGKDTDAIFLDFHAEATSEKMAIAHYLGGQVTAVVGTHTHVPTADAHIMKSGTAFMADAGMTGDYDSIIGVQTELSLHRFVKKTPGERFIPAKGPATLCGVLIESNDDTGLAKTIQPIRVGGVLPKTA